MRRDPVFATIPVMLNPRMVSITQRFDAPSIAADDLFASVTATLDQSGIAVSAGESIAIAAGSRGIADIAAIVTAVVAWVKSRGADPFLVPAMGSHGGATAAGQFEVLESYGITESQIGRAHV